MRRRARGVVQGPRLFESCGQARRTPRERLRRGQAAGLPGPTHPFGSLALATSSKRQYDAFNEALKEASLGVTVWDEQHYRQSLKVCNGGQLRLTSYFAECGVEDVLAAGWKKPAWIWRCMAIQLPRIFYWTALFATHVLQVFFGGLRW